MLRYLVDIDGHRLAAPSSRDLEGVYDELDSEIGSVRARSPQSPRKLAGEP